MRNYLFIFLLIIEAITIGCSKNSPLKTAFDDVKRQGNYQLIASTIVGEDRVEFWQEFEKTDDSFFGRFLMVAVNQSSSLIDFRMGRFVSSCRPFFQTSRYVVLVAGSTLGDKRTVFFVYDSRLKKFFTYFVDESVPHIHENIIIQGNSLFFASCKTLTPVGRLNLSTGKVTMFGNPAPQSAKFYLSGSDVFIEGNDKKIYKMDKDKLTQVDTVISKNMIIEMLFDTILKTEKSE